MKKMLFLILIISFSSCVSRKYAVKENVKLSAVEIADLQAKEITSRSSYTNVTKDVKTNVSDRTVTTVTEMEYSKPDQRGKQHKTKEKTTEIRNDLQTVNEANERTINNQKEMVERLIVENSELKTKLDAALSEKTKTSTRASFWMYIVTAAIGAGGALIVRRWIKTRFRFLKGKAF